MEPSGDIHPRLVSPVYAKSMTRLSLLVAMLTIGVSLIGISDPNIYRSTTPEHLIPGAVGQDIASLIFGLLVIVTVTKLGSGSQQTWLLWLGLVAYIAYAYAIYSFEAVYNLFYLAYVAIFGLSIYAIILFFVGVSIPKDIGGSIGRLLRKMVAFLFGVLVLMFSVLWLSIVLPAMQTGVAPEGNTIHVLDLAFVLPLLTIEAVLLLRAVPLGDFLAVPLLIKSGSIGVSVLLGSLMAPIFDLPIIWSELPIYVILGLVPLSLVWPFLRRLNL